MNETSKATSDREALANVLREIGPKPGGVMNADRIAAKLLDHEWFRQTVERRGREVAAMHPDPPNTDTEDNR